MRHSSGESAPTPPATNSTRPEVLSYQSEILPPVESRPFVYRLLGTIAIALAIFAWLSVFVVVWAQGSRDRFSRDLEGIFGSLGQVLWLCSTLLAVGIHSREKRGLFALCLDALLFLFALVATRSIH
jgi:hypothetical protein